MKLPLLIVVLASGFAAGRLSAPRSAGMQTSESPLKHSPATKSAPSSATLGDHHLLNVAPALDRETLTRLRLARIDGDGRRAELARLAQATRCAQTEEELRLLFTAWGHADPAAALAAVEEHFSGDVTGQLRESIVAGWVRRDPAAAFAWSTAPERERSYVLTAVEHLARDEPQRAIPFLAQLTGDDSSLREQAYGTVLDAAARRAQFDTATAILSQLPDGPTRQNLTLQVASEWARVQPQDAAHWTLALHEGAERTKAIAAVAEAWSRRDPERAAEFARALPSGETRQHAIQEAVTGWIDRDIVAASKWLDRLDAHTDTDPAIAALATAPTFANYRPEAALGWAESISAGPRRFDAIQEITQSWARRDFSAAARYVENSPALSAAERERLSATLREAAEQTPSAAAQ